jgi:hypothetical protein
MSESILIRSWDSLSDNRKSKIQNQKWTGLLAIVVALTTCGVRTEAQQAKKIPRIGFLSAGSASTHSPRDEAFRQGLRDLGMRREKTLSSSTGLPKAKLNASPI